MYYSRDIFRFQVPIWWIEPYTKNLGFSPTINRVFKIRELDKFRLRNVRPHYVRLDKLADCAKIVKNRIP